MESTLEASEIQKQEEDIPRFRFAVMGVIWVTAVFLYFDRVNISMAAPHIMKDLSLTAVEMGLILSMFSWGFIPGQLIGGYVADRYGIRKWATFLYFVWCIATVLTGMCRTLFQFIVVRFIFGFAEGSVGNNISKFPNNWVFPRERGFANGLTMGSAYLGLALGMPIVGWLISISGWRTMFYISGVVTIFGVLLFWRYIYDRPSQHPKISEREKNALETALARDRVTPHQSGSEAARPSLKESLQFLLTNRIYWTLCGAFLFIHAIYITNFSWLPGYLVMERGFSEINSGAALMLPYLSAGGGAFVGGVLSDKLGRRSDVILFCALLTIPAIGGLLFFDHPVIIVATLSLLLFCNAAATSIFVVLLFDLFPPQMTGVALALLSGIFGGVGGVSGPLIMGFSYDLSGSFAYGFICMAVGMVISVGLMATVLGHERRTAARKAANSQAGYAQ